MAVKHDWGAIKRDYNDQVLGNNVPLKQFAEEQGISYNYMRKMSSTWKQDREIAHADYILAVEEETRSSDTMPAADRNMCHIRAYDKALEHCMTILENPELHLMTQEGIFKPANLERVTTTIEKIQRGQRLALGLDKETRDSKSLLGDISDAITVARERYGDIEDTVDGI